MRLLHSAILALGICGCSGHRLPKGTPPPEYELPVVTPWASDGADAGSDRADEGAGATDASAPSPELSPDAGVR